MQQLRSCKEFIPSFSAKLKALDIAALPASVYSKRYLGHLQQNGEYYLHIYAHVLDNVMAEFEGPLSSLTLLDYGCGNGLLGLFAKSCGVKSVYLCDTDHEFIHAAKATAAMLEIEPDEYIAGDITSVSSNLEGVSINAVVGTDVIEHIYDLDVFFSAVARLPGAGITVFTTASNPDNFLKKRALQKLQVRDELVGSDPGDAVLTGAHPHEAFLVLRENIIRENFPGLETDQLKLVAKNTRGLKKGDIINACRLYFKTGALPQVMVPGTNTCDPLTGSWTERILPLKSYAALYKKFGMSLTIKNGFYNAYGAGLKKTLNKMRNVLIKLTGRNTAPFITLVGCKNRP